MGVRRIWRRVLTTRSAKQTMPLRRWGGLSQSFEASVCDPTFRLVSRTRPARGGGGYPWERFPSSPRCLMSAIRQSKMRLKSDASERCVMASDPSFRKAVILIVEDDALIRMSVADSAEDAGFEVLEAANADEAVRILESRSDIRIIFTDVDMPGSMDGVRLAAAVRNRWPPIEIVLTSGCRKIADGDLPDRGVFIPKPYAHAGVVATLRRLIA